MRVGCFPQYQREQRLPQKGPSPMSYPFRITLPLARSVAIAALISASLVAAPLAAFAAEPAPAGAATATKPISASPGDQKNVEQRITQLHAELKIAPEQESKWNSVAQAMRDNAANMEKLVAEKRQQGPQNMTAVDDLKTYQEFAQAHVDGLKNLTSAFSSLYDSMSDQQKKNADEVFAKFNRAAPNHNG
jgi:periplasmic protein CpxP/Spy